MPTPREIIDRAKQIPDTFEVMLSSTEDDVIVMRNVKDLRLVTARKEKAKDLLKISESKTVPLEWRKFLPITPEMADVIAALAIDAVPPWTDLEGLELCATNGVLAAVIYTQIQQKMLLALSQNELEQIEAEKNALPPTESTVPTSPSARNGSTSTRTTSPNRTGSTPANI